MENLASDSVPNSVRRGRPPREAAAAHAAILDAVYDLLKEKSARDLTMEEVARRAKVGKPTLYKWWPTKAALVLAMFHERIASQAPVAETKTVEESIRLKTRRLIQEFNGLFGKVMGDLIAEGQSEPDLLRDLSEQHMAPRRAATAADIERAKVDGEFLPDMDTDLVIDAIFGPIYFRLLMRQQPLTEAYGDALIDQALHRWRVG
jgi:AcrR family transcriptional regulator